jgi:phosphoserine phosphatase
MAVGGTSSDIPLLKMVDQAIAFNPNQALFKAANENDWMVVVERKDVVYGLQKNGSTYELKQSNA